MTETANRLKPGEWVVLGGLGLVVLVVGGFVLWYHSQVAEQKEAIDSIIIWDGARATVPAKEAEERWDRLRGNLGPLYDRLPLESRVTPWRVLGRKYFAERDYGRCLDMREREREVLGRDVYAVSVYVAGLAGRGEWLAQLLRENKKDREPGFEQFVKANLAWIAGDDDQTLALTQLPDDFVRDDPSREIATMAPWLLLMRAKALARKGQCEVATKVMDEELAPLWGKVYPGEEIDIHVRLLYVKTAERAGKFALALEVAENVEYQFSAMIEQSWSHERRELVETIGRLKFELSKTQGTTSPHRRADLGG